MKYSQNHFSADPNLSIRSGAAPLLEPITPEESTDRSYSPRLGESELKASLLRCQYAETCRRRDAFGRDNGWHARSVAVATYGLRQALRACAWVKDSFVDGVRTIRKLPDAAPLCADAEVVSFDLFDTLVYRSVEPPEQLKRVAANFAAERYAKRGFPLTTEIFLYLRDESERRQRRVTQSRGADSECRLSEVIHETLYRLFGSEAADREASILVQYEIKVEIEHLHVAEGVTDLLQGLKSQGKRIVVASDTYFEREHLRQILAHLGIDRWIDAVYASSEQLVGKYSGRLFQTILRAEGVAPSRMIHFGDTYQSDIRGAVKASVPAVFLFDVDRLRRRWRLARNHQGLQDKAIDRSAVPLRPVAFRAAKHARGSDRPELYQIGRDIMGPAFTLFVLDVTEESHRFGATDIYFLAREGWLFRQLYEILTTAVGPSKRRPPIQHHYLYVSRLSTSLPAIRQLSQRELHLAFYRDHNAPLCECIAAFGLNPEDYGDLGFNLSDRKEATKTALFANSIFRERVHRRAETARARLRLYLAQQGFFRSKDVKLIVDIGWNATIQANLTQAFHDDPDFPLLVGYYFGRRYRHEDYLVSSRSLYMPGRFFDQKRPIAVEHAVGHCLELFELTAAAPHGATLNYEETDGVVKPVLSASGMALSQEQKLLQAGILDHAKAFVNAAGDKLDLPVLRFQAATKLSQLILHPTYRQAQALSRLRHAVDWGSQKSRPLIAENMGPFLIFMPGRLVGGLRESYWLEGCMRLLGIPGALTGLYWVRRAVRAKDLLLRLWHPVRDLFQSQPVPAATTPWLTGGWDLKKTSHGNSESAGL